MTTDESMEPAAEAARAAVVRFYDALHKLALGGGVEEMYDTWHHIDEATTVHPFGHWSVGWAEVAATWAELAVFFAQHRVSKPGGRIDELRVHLLGPDSAYTTSRFQAVFDTPNGELEMNLHCTNVVLLRDGAWKVIHHHPDNAPKVPDALAAIAAS